VPPDRIERVDFAERWFRDGFRVIDAPGGFALLDVDMSRARSIIERLRARGLKATYNHVLVRAAALVLARRPDLHQLVAGRQRLHPGRVDIGLSVAGKTSYAPVMILEDAAQKTLPQLCEEIARRIPEIQAKEEKDLAWMRRWGWIIPFGFLRRAIIRWLTASVKFRRKLAGTFQVSCSSLLDVMVSFLFYSAATLGAGRVRDAVVALEGQPAVRPIITLSCCVDHKVWDGMRAAIFLGEMKQVLEQGELEAEVG
jgi:pyruvate/2-oxoglutarate dehydrogenase complex dihydrolipoamide acyltransferase (E2) component